MDITPKIPESIKSKIEPFMEQGRQRAKEIHEGKTNLTLKDEEEIAAGTATVDKDGYLIYDYYQLQNAKLKHKQELAKELSWADIISQAPDDYNDYDTMD